MDCEPIVSDLRALLMNAEDEISEGAYFASLQSIRAALSVLNERDSDSAAPAKCASLPQKHRKPSRTVSPKGQPSA